MVVHHGCLRTVQTIGNFFSRLSAAQELADLREQVDRLSFEAQFLRGEAEEAKRLRRLFELTSPPTLETVSALVTNFNMQQDGMSGILIGRGTDDGLQINQPVLSSKGLIGRVERVLKRMSRVQLLDDPGSLIGVTIEGKNWVGVIRGRVGEGKMHLTDLRQRYAYGMDAGPLPEVGDRLHTSGIGSTFPAGLLAGTISERLEDEVDLVFSVRPVYDVYQISEVLVVSGIDRTEENILLTDQDFPSQPIPIATKTPDSSEEKPLSTDIQAGTIADTTAEETIEIQSENSQEIPTSPENDRETVTIEANSVERSGDAGLNATSSGADIVAATLNVEADNATP